MTCQCQRHARCADCMERDALTRQARSSLIEQFLQRMVDIGVWARLKDKT